MLLKIAHAFNLANCGWPLVKGLRAIGVDAHLIVHRPAHVASLPQWEEAEIDLSRITDAYNPDWGSLGENWSMPTYVHTFHMIRPWYAASVDALFNRIGAKFRAYSRWFRCYSSVLKFWASLIEMRGGKAERQLMWMLQDYDLVVGHAPFASHAPRYQAITRRPYIIYDAGWIRYLYDSTYGSPFLQQAVKGYKNASRILFGNVDTYRMFVTQGYDPCKLAYTPPAIDTEIYRPLKHNNLSIHRVGSPVFFMPSRPDPTKGNMMVIHAFERYLKRRPNAVLRIVNWGPQQEEYQQHLRLIKKLGIERGIRWLPVMNKRLLVRHFDAADVVYDQFKLGALGLTTPEAMSCGKPVVAYVKPELWTPWHKEPPPVANARTTEEIHRQMIALEDEGLRKELGSMGQRWVLENCEMKMVAKDQKRLYEETMRH